MRMKNLIQKGNPSDVSSRKREYGKIPKARLNRELFDLVKTGIVYSLSFINQDPPKFPIGVPPLKLAIARRHKIYDYDIHQQPTENTVFTEANESITMSCHSITHLDALCHIGEVIDGKVRLYDNILADEVEHDKGFKKLGIEQCPPIITRGVLLDVALYKGLDVLPKSYTITAEDLEATSEREGVEIKHGDCVLIRTALPKIWSQQSETFYRSGPGLGVEAAQWLIDKGVIVSGADTISYEKCPSPTHPVHRKMINNNGVLLMKMLNLEEIAEEKIYEFLFVAIPLRIFGATASPINPIAIC
jgi:kynurenine formamidase